MAAYILEKGDYIVRVGKNSRDNTPVCKINVKDIFIHKKVVNRLPLNEKFDELKKPNTNQENYAGLLCLNANLTA